MAKTDIESVLDGVKAFLVANLNTQIAALNAEKNDGISLKSVNATAYHLQYPQDRTELGDPFVVYDEAQEPRIEANGGMVAAVHSVGVSIVLADNGLDGDIVKRLFRYRRALQDLFSDKWASVYGSHKFKMRLWSPTPPFKNMETQYTGRAVGIILEVAVAD
jgi:hypothetical protein